MRNLINIAEMQLAPPQDIAIPNSDQSENIGSIGFSDGQIIISHWENNNWHYYWAKIRNTEKNIAFVGIQEASGGISFWRYATILPEFSRKGIVSEMMQFIINDIGTMLLNDTVMTQAGVDLLFSLIRSNKFKTSIAYLPTAELFTLADVGKSTKDGSIIIPPERDSVDSDSYDPTTGAGQRFFYMLETLKSVPLVVEGIEYNRGYVHSRHKPPSLYGNYRYFNTGDV